MQFGARRDQQVRRPTSTLPRMLGQLTLNVNSPGTNLLCDRQTAIIDTEPGQRGQILGGRLSAVQHLQVNDGAGGDAALTEQRIEGEAYGLEVASDKRTLVDQVSISLRCAFFRASSSRASR